jgi:pyruvate/2-oxoglutarate dehydrogenase complex dihydrolipoamide acyltransferase (E2) component
LTCAGSIRQKPLVIDNEIKIQSVLNITSTGDHRFGDAAIFLPLEKTFLGYVANPEHFYLDSVKENLHWSERK